MPSLKLLEKLSPRAFLAGAIPPAAASASGLAGIDRIALAACLAGGGSSAALILTKLICL